MQHAGGMLLTPVQTLAATLIFAPLGQKCISSPVVFADTATTHSGGGFFGIAGLEPIAAQHAGGMLLTPTDQDGHAFINRLQSANAYYIRIKYLSINSKEQLLVYSRK